MNKIIFTFLFQIPQKLRFLETCDKLNSLNYFMHFFFPCINFVWALGRFVMNSLWALVNVYNLTVLGHLLVWLCFISQKSEAFQATFYIAKILFDECIFIFSVIIYIDESLLFRLCLWLQDFSLKSIFD